MNKINIVNIYNVQEDGLQKYLRRLGAISLFSLLFISPKISSLFEQQYLTTMTLIILELQTNI